jgi:molybdenum cofactor cytidylyltransferase
MGRPKLALPLGERTVLEHVIDALRRAEITDILVIIAPHAAELRPLAEAAGALVYTLPEETVDMRATVEHGLERLEALFQPSPADNWMLVPADHPTLDPAVVRQLLQARHAQPAYSILIPTFEGRRGHPTLIAWQHVAGIRGFPAGLGLNVYLRQHAAETLELAVSSAEILCDLDTPQEYEQLLLRFRPPQP